MLRVITFVATLQYCFAFPPGCSSFGCDPFRSGIVHGVLLGDGAMLADANVITLVTVARPDATLPS